MAESKSGILTLVSIDNDDKLREKVDEAMTVYDDYVKNSGEGQSNQQETEGNAEEGGETKAEPEAQKA